MIDKLKAVRVVLRFSDDDKWFYVEGDEFQHPFWLSNMVFQERPHVGLFDGVVLLNRGKENQQYRRFLPFSSYKVRSVLLHRAEVTADDTRVVDYYKVAQLIFQSCTRS